MHNERFNDLATIRKLAIVCEDCGRRRVWREADIAVAQVRHSVRSTLQLGAKLSCSLCKERGARSFNISVYVDPLDRLPLIACAE